MATDETGALGAELRRIREGAGLSGSAVARAVGWSQPKLSRFETGRFGASLSEVAALLDYYGVAEEVRAELLARTARREGLAGAWVVRAGGAPRRQGEVGSAESRVVRLRQYQALTVPGLLQSRAYAHAVVEAAGFDDPGAVVSRRVDRQRAFFDRAVPYEVVLDARALGRWPGADSVMRDQLLALVADDQPGLDLRVLPPGGGARAVSVGSFVMYEFADDRPAVVLSEAQTADLYLSDEADVSAYAGLFEGLVQDSLTVGESREYLRGVLRDLQGT